jgi:hypothetical protein
MIIVCPPFTQIGPVLPRVTVIVVAQMCNRARVVWVPEDVHANCPVSHTMEGRT